MVKIEGNSVTHCKSGSETQCNSLCHRFAFVIPSETYG